MKLDPLPIESINHIARVTRDLDASTAFYRDVLGFRSIQRPDFGFPGAWLFNYVADSNVTQLFFHDPDGNHIEIGTYPPIRELEAIK